jgi:hypothetical protein
MAFPAIFQGSLELMVFVFRTQFFCAGETLNDIFMSSLRGSSLLNCVSRLIDFMTSDSEIIKKLLRCGKFLPLTLPGILDGFHGFFVGNMKSKFIFLMPITI